jgi:RNA-directed DNA polymerase
MNKMTRPIPVDQEMVDKAYHKVRRGGKAAGIDNESWTEFDKKKDQNLYVIWNRMSSGSYHPQAVREVEIPKKDGSTRKLGIPTLRDRIAQQVVKEYMEERIDKLFHENSYGYRPMRSAHQALKVVQKNCIEKDWVIDMDISKFFDEIDHELMLKAVEHVMEEKWVRMYVERWLKMGIVDVSGNHIDKGDKGTPQGGVISPLLANLYLHYTLDKWLEKMYPEVSFVRYADDVVIHCKTKEEAGRVLEGIRNRLSQVKLSIKESKTKIAYCKDYRRTQEHEVVKFEFLGFSFQPIGMKVKKGESAYFLGRGSKISPTNLKRINEMIRTEKTMRNTSLEISEISKSLNPKLRGWINYYSVFSTRCVYTIATMVDKKLLKWIRKKYKVSILKSIRKLYEFKQLTPKLFYHWEKGIVRLNQNG